MKRALVLSLMIVGLGVAGLAGTLGGGWNIDLALDPSDDSFSVTSLLTVDYTLGGWTFGMNSVVTDVDGLDDLSFDVVGVMGAFTIVSFLDFDDTDFEVFNIGASVSIAGVDLMGMFVLQPLTVGYWFGAHAVAGDVELWAEVDFGAGSQIYYWYNYGWGYLVDWDIYYDCRYGYTTWPWTLGAANACDPVFSGFAIYAEVPFCCLDLLATIAFDCDGFDRFCIELNDIDLGAGWFQLDDLNICFTTQTKSISGFDFTLILGDAVCVTPYLDVTMETYTITGIELQALLLTCEINGVTFKAGEFFGDIDGYYIGFKPNGSLVTYNYAPYLACWVAGADEYFGVEIDGDSCCGGAFDASFFVFFDAGEATAATGIFDWLKFYGDVSVDIGTNVALSLGIETSPDQIDLVKFGFEYSF